MKTVRYAMILGLICFVAAFGLSGTYRLSSERIAEKAAAERARAQNSVISASGDAELRFSVLNPDASEPMQVVEAKNAAGERLGYAALGEAQGYGGPIRVMVGMDPKAERLLGVAIVSQSETPGLGSRIAEVKSNKTWSRVLTGRGGGETEETTPEFLKQYLGRTLDELVLGKGIDGLTGATVSSAAVVEAARSAVKRIKAVVSTPAVSPASGKASGGEGAGK